MKWNRLAAGIAAAALTLSIGFPSLAAPKTMSDGGIFDAEYYAQNNPDVTAALGTDEEVLYQHYKTFGEKEGRLPYAPGTETQAAAAEDTASESSDSYLVTMCMVPIQSAASEISDADYESLFMTTNVFCDGSTFAIDGAPAVMDSSTLELGSTFSRATYAWPCTSCVFAYMPENTDTPVYLTGPELSEYIQSHFGTLIISVYGGEASQILFIDETQYLVSLIS